MGGQPAPQIYKENQLFVGLRRILVGTLPVSLAVGPLLAQGDSGASPLQVSVSYTGMLVGNVAGGVEQGARYAGLAGAQGALDLDRLAGWGGASFFVMGLFVHGDQPSELVGDLQGVSNLEAPSGLRLEEAWLQQNFLRNRASVLLGQYDLSTEFYRLQSGALFLNSSFGTGPEFGLSGSEGPSIYPYTSLGARAEYKPMERSVVRVAVMDGEPVIRPEGSPGVFSSADGLLLVGEAAWLTRPDTGAPVPRERRFQIGRGLVRPYGGKVAVGGWYYTRTFADLSDTLPDGSPVERQGSYGVYGIADQEIWRDGKGSARAVMLFGQLGFADPKVNQVAGYLGGGITLVAPFKGRAQDEVGLGVAAARIGSHYKRSQERLGLDVSGGETAIELTYLFQLAGWCAIQPDVQYVIDPGALRSVPDAFVLGLRVALTH